MTSESEDRRTETDLDTGDELEGSDLSPRAAGFEPRIPNQPNLRSPNAQRPVPRRPAGMAPRLRASGASPPRTPPGGAYTGGGGGQEPPVWRGRLLQNPFVLAGFAVSAAVVLAVVIVVFFGTSRGGSSANGDGNGVAVDPLTPVSGRGFAARSISTSTVRSGPGLEFSALGELVRNQDVEVNGRNPDSSWFSIYYPIGSQIRGWVPASALRIENASAIPVVDVTPIPLPTVNLPTRVPEPTATITPIPSVTPTPTPAGATDVAASLVAGTCALGQRLVVNVANVGQAAIAGKPIAVQVLNSSGQVTLTVQSPNLPPGQSVPIDTGYVVQERVVVVLDPLGTLGDSNTANNRADCVVTGGQVTPTPVRTITAGLITATPPRP